MNLQISIKAGFQVVRTPFKAIFEHRSCVCFIEVSSLAASGSNYARLVGKDLT